MTDGLGAWVGHAVVFLQTVGLGSARFGYRSNGMPLAQPSGVLLLSACCCPYFPQLCATAVMALPCCVALLALAACFGYQHWLSW